MPAGLSAPLFPGGGDDETVEFDTNLDDDFDDTVRTIVGQNAFSPGFCGGIATSPSPSDVHKRVCRNPSGTDLRPEGAFGFHVLRIGLLYRF
ncbi:MAG: hypothetical protein AB7I50_15845 [Vicinamibacterales bacterium]